MEKTLIILGNGFDLDLGWNTSYSDFYKAYQHKFISLNRMSFIEKGKLTETYPPNGNSVHRTTSFIRKIPLQGDLQAISGNNENLMKINVEYLTNS